MGLCAPWTTAVEVTACPPYEGLDADAVEWAVDAASEVLFALSGEQFPGSCTDVVRPSGQCGGRGGCCSTPLVNLGVSPITAVSRVTVAGEDLDPSEYRILDGLWLVRTNRTAWPCCPDVTLEPPAFEVAFSWGQAPPAMGRLAAQVLAGELALSRCGSGECQLDRRVQSITRQGVTMQMAIPGLVDALAGGGRTGIAEVDLFVHAHNPAGLRRAPTLVVPGQHPSAHRISPLA